MKFSGNVGFVKTVESAPSVWTSVDTPRHYYGDVVKNRVKIESRKEIISGITLSNNISIVADKYMKENLGYIKYVELNGIKWSVSDIEMAYPRIILSIGEVYNGG